MAGANQGFDAVVVGAGFPGTRMLKPLRGELGSKDGHLAPFGADAPLC